MNRTEAKELLPIIQAFAEGKTIEFKNCNGNWDNCGNALIPGFHKEYRIKPESEYRPFKNTDECWQEMLKHQPFGWVCTREHNWYKHINNLFANTISFQESEIEASGNFEWGLLDLFENVTFADGAPFGIREVETFK
mgnify:CR=1 FL=1